MGVVKLAGYDLLALGVDKAEFSVLVVERQALVHISIDSKRREHLLLAQQAVDTCGRVARSARLLPYHDIALAEIGNKTGHGHLVGCILPGYGLGTRGVDETKLAFIGSDPCHAIVELPWLEALLEAELLVALGVDEAVHIGEHVVVVVFLIHSHSCKPLGEVVGLVVDARHHLVALAVDIAVFGTIVVTLHDVGQPIVKRIDGTVGSIARGIDHLGASLVDKAATGVVVHIGKALAEVGSLVVDAVDYLTARSVHVAPLELAVVTLLGTRHFLGHSHHAVGKVAHIAVVAIEAIVLPVGAHIILAGNEARYHLGAGRVDIAPLAIAAHGSIAVVKGLHDVVLGNSCLKLGGDAHLGLGLSRKHKNACIKKETFHNRLGFRF